MFKKERKVLFVSEASFANTGFSNIYYELLSRLSKKPGIRVAELASDCIVNDPRDDKSQWRFYPNQVQPGDSRHDAYKSMPDNKFGRWRFDKVLLDFEPDIVYDLRDPPYFQYQHRTALRPFFHWCISPTVDSAPQPPEWIETFKQADSVRPYTGYGADTINNADPSINLCGVLNPGVDTDKFRPMDKAALRRKHGIPVDHKILGFVSRNQVRKRFPELLQAFKKYVSSILPASERNRYHLHIHTAYPDLNPWHISRLLIEEDLLNNVYFTYKCSECGRFFLERWQGAVTRCKHCGKNSAKHPKTNMGCSTEDMCEIYNLYDMYAQVANCEGMGLGLLEAAACGIPIMGVDYSAMSEIIHNLNGYSLIPNGFYRDINVDAWRANISPGEIATRLKETFELPKEILNKYGMHTRELCVANYNWDDRAERLYDHFMSIQLKGKQGKWGEAPDIKINNKSRNMLEHVTNRISNAGGAHFAKSSFTTTLVKECQLNKHGLSKENIDEKMIENVLTNIETKFKDTLAVNSGDKIMAPEDFIEYATIKELANA